ncbi:acyltransferase family protein [Pseudomonas lopnurensis]|uniref:acyltransferase family protein n=1 Tax=Pseudomonas lopnurensis TaxID=1477517 RepID=UPI0028A8428A|nr:acyltransferase [Pseudomonas lopnurensis]
MERLAHIDALRGSAVMLVVFQALFVPLLGHPWLLQHALDPGLLGTLWFVLISGFVVPASLRADARHFVTRRCLRLFPAGAVATLLVVAVLGPASAGLFADATANVASPPFEVLRACGPLPVVLVFYLLCLGFQWSGLLQSVSLRSGCALLLLALALLLALVRYLFAMSLPVTLPLVLSLMFFASVWHEAQHEDSSYARRRAREYARHTLRFYGLVLPVIFLAGWASGLEPGESGSRYLFTYVLAIGGFLLLSSRLPLSSPLLIWLGGISYSLYLLLPTLQPAVHRLTAGLDLAGGTNALLGAVLGTLLALVAAQLCRRLVEQPFIHLGKRLAGRRNAQPLMRLHSR